LTDIEVVSYSLSSVYMNREIFNRVRSLTGIASEGILEGFVVAEAKFDPYH